MSTKIDTIIDNIENMTAGEVAELVSAIEAKFNVSADLAVSAVGAGGGGAGAEAEQTEFTVQVSGLGAAPKIKLIKTIKDVTGLSLVDAKALTNKYPIVIKEKISKEDAEAIKEKFAAISAEVEIK